jgi:hypothetical protein
MCKIKKKHIEKAIKGSEMRFQKAEESIMWNVTLFNIG